MFRREEQEQYACRQWAAPKRCLSCRKSKAEALRQEKARKENESWQRQHTEEVNEFERRLSCWNVVPVDDVRPSKKVLYIIGNGFDLMHGARSGYSSFRDSLGRNSSLRQALDTVLTADDIWADFEEALAHFDMDMMGSDCIVDGWMDIFDAYDEDASAADFFLAVEAAANPMMTISEELPRRFRNWVESLTIGTDDRPLDVLFRDSKVLCFNYTEFVEELYGVSKENVCYVHGCRRKEKNKRKEPLILGHRSGASDTSFDMRNTESVGRKSERESYLLEAAQENVFRLVSEIDDGLTKDSRKIIQRHAAFFDSVTDVEEIVVVGHSHSEVDWDYFEKIYRDSEDKGHLRWYFGCYGLRDLDNLEKMLDVLGIERSQVCLFRTDTIRVNFFPPKEPQKNTAPKSRRLCTSPDGIWSAVAEGHILRFVENVSGVTDLEIEKTGFVNKGLFIPEEHCFLAVQYGLDAGVFLFRLADGHWQFVDELEAVRNQDIVNKRLKKALYHDHELIFVYNSRVRKYSLETGKLTANRAQQRAADKEYEGICVTKYFLMSMGANAGKTATEGFTLTEKCNNDNL